MIKTLGHVKDFQAKGDGVYMPPSGWDLEDYFIPQPSMMQEFLGDDYVPKEWTNDESQGTNPNVKVEGSHGNFINLNDFS
jgi:hypothetical protein